MERTVERKPNEVEARREEIRPVAEGVGLSLADAPCHQERRRGRCIAGLTLNVALISLLAFGAFGCSKEAPSPSGSGVKQEQVDKTLQARKRVALDEAHRRQKDVNEIRNLKAAGVLKPGQTALKFGDMWISPDDEPGWYRMTRLNAAGAGHYSDEEIRKAMAGDYNEILKNMHAVKSGYRAGVDRNNFEMLSQFLKPQAK